MRIGRVMQMVNLNTQIHKYMNKKYLLKFATMMGMGKVMHSTWNMTSELLLQISSNEN